MNEQLDFYDKLYPKPKERMRILVACEESQEVCKAFRAKGHEAYSCDVQPCSGGGRSVALTSGCSTAFKDGMGHDFSISTLHLYDKRRSSQNES